MTRGPLLALACLAALAATSSRADTATVIITKADCARLVKHVPAPDVAYQDGVDVYGRPVAPADLDGGSRLALPEEIFITIEVDLFDRFNTPPNGVNYDADAIIGLVRYADGRFTFNRQPLESDEEAALAERCQAIDGATP
jgi:hypothetical protein